MGRFSLDRHDNDIIFISDNSVQYNFEDAVTYRNRLNYDKFYMILDSSPLFDEFEDNDYDADVFGIIYEIAQDSTPIALVSMGSNMSLESVVYMLTGDSKNKFVIEEADSLYRDILNDCDDAARRFEQKYPEIVELYQDPIGYAESHGYVE